MSLAQCRMISFRKFEDKRGRLTPIEGTQDIPFDIKRAFYLYDIPGGASRAGHAHKTLHQVFIAMSGSFDVTVRDGESDARYHMNRAYFGLYIPPMVWPDLDNFSSGSVCLVLASEHYREEDYLSTYPEYMVALSKLDKNG